MKSYWRLTCELGKANIVLKKFERLLSVHALLVESEKVNFEKLKTEIFDFFLDHNEIDDWQKVVFEIFNITGRISRQWRVNAYESYFEAHFELKKEYQYPAISGLINISWRVSHNQEYRREKFNN